MQQFARRLNVNYWAKKMNRNIQSPTKSLSSPSWTSFVTSNNSGFNVIPASNNNGSTLNASIINMSGTQQSPLQQQSFTATIHTTGAAQNQINSNRYACLYYTWYLILVLSLCFVWISVHRNCRCKRSLCQSNSMIIWFFLPLSLYLALFSPWCRFWCAILEFVSQNYKWIESSASAAISYTTIFKWFTVVNRSK